MKIQNGFSIAPLTAEAKAAQDDKNLRDAAKMYEGYFLNEMVRAMRSTVPQEDGLVKKNFAEKIFTEQLDGKYVEGWSDKGGIGLADMIYNQVKERMAGVGKSLPIGVPAKQMLPLTPRGESGGMKPTDSIQFRTLPGAGSGAGVGAPEASLNMRFEVPDPSGGGFDVQSPFPGRVLESKALADGWSLVKLEHDGGLRSEMTFPGMRAQIGAGEVVTPGQKLGTVDSTKPVLAWNLDWS